MNLPYKVHLNLYRPSVDKLKSSREYDLDDLEDVSTNKTTLNTVNAYLIGMHIRSDLVTDTYILPKLSEEVVDLLK